MSRQHGGKGANQAVAAARAGATVHLVGAVGVADGASSLDALAAENVDVTHVTRVDAPTGHAVVLVDDTSGENQIAVAPGANALVSADQVDAAGAALGLRPDDVIVLSFELPHPPLRLAADLARRAGARLVINPAPADPAYADVLAGAIATPNAGELADWVGPVGCSGGARAAALELSRRTGAPVVATLGADGALLAGSGAAEHVPAPRVEARDTTGAGDTLTGVLAASLAQGHKLRAAVRRAVVAASLAVTLDGARAGMPAAAAIDRMLEG